jgi:hypothetical protein
LREIGGKECPVALNESLYVAIDEDGKRIPTINEAVHRSLITRYGKAAQLCTEDDKGTCTAAAYAPKTLAPFFRPTGFSGLPIFE